jgi:hypothetical protein
MAFPWRRRVSVKVVLPLSGWLMMAMFRRLATSEAWRDGDEVADDDDDDGSIAADDRR